MKIVFAIDSFKGSIGSVAAGRAAAEGARRVFPDAELVVAPLADGGEGTVDALVEGLGGERLSVAVEGPLGKPVMAKYGLLPDGRAVMEMAEAAGLTLVPPDERDILRASTFGVGQMISDALAHGATKILMGIGGSATNDGGAGMLQALGWRLLDQQGRDLPRGGAALSRLDRIVPPPQLPKCAFRIACDVDNPLCGPRGASAVYGPQKGASPDDVALLDAALGKFAAVADPAGRHAEKAGAGAAGGLGFAFSALLGGELVRGAELVCEETHLAEAIAGADLVVTGEGRMDAQTACGKAPVGVARLAASLGVRTVALCGCVGDGAEAVNDAGIAAFFPVLRCISTPEEAMEPMAAARNIADTAEQMFRCLRLFGN